MWINFLKVGSFISDEGTSVNVTEALIDEMVSTYDSKNFAAPITCGHPKHASDPNAKEEPAYGTIAEIKKFGTSLCFRLKSLVTEFGDEINKGKYPNLSPGIESIKGKASLNHVAFLGSSRPAVPGLDPIMHISLSANSKVQCLTTGMTTPKIIQLGAPETDNVTRRFNAVASILTSIREFMIDKYDLETADKHIPTWDLEWINTPLPEAQAFSTEDTTTTNFSAPIDNIDYKKLYTKQAEQIVNLSANVNSLTERITENAASDKQALIDSSMIQLSAYVDGLVNDSKILPGEKDFV